MDETGLRFRLRHRLLLGARAVMSNIRKVMLVDDEPDIRRIAQLSLQHLGPWQVVVAASGREAVDQARSEAPDLILLDVMMPQMDGPQTLQELRSDPSLEETPVIFMTAKTRHDDLAHYVSIGAVGVIAKPFNPVNLAGDIRRILDTALQTPRAEP